MIAQGEANRRDSIQTALKHHSHRTGIKGVKICEQAKGRWTNEWAACPRLNDPNYFWLTGEFTDHEPENEKNDHWALANGYVAITPTTVDVTAYHFMDELNKWFN